MSILGRTKASEQEKSLVLITENCNQHLIEGLCYNFSRANQDYLMCDLSNKNHLPRFDKNNVSLITCLYQDDNAGLVNLLFLIDALVRMDVKNISVIFSYFGHLRLHRSYFGGSVPAVLVPKLLKSAGVKNIFAVDTHTPTDGVENLSCEDIFALLLKGDANYDKDSSIVLAPDTGGIERASNFARICSLPFSYITKIRNNSKGVCGTLSSPIYQKNCIIIDDMIDTGATLEFACKKTVEQGVSRIILLCTHLLKTSSLRKIAQQYPQISKIFITNSVRHTSDFMSDKITYVDLKNLITHKVPTLLKAG